MRDGIARRGFMKALAALPFLWTVPARDDLIPIYRKQDGRFFRCRMYELVYGDVFLREGRFYRAVGPAFEIDHTNRTGKVWAVPCETVEVLREEFDGQAYHG